MLVSGVQQFSILDYPEKTACIVFTPGCNFRCGYCHNPEFVLPENILKIKDSFIPEETVFNFLTTRKGLLDGVVITGGEPTIAPDLLPFMAKVKSLGFFVKLDTNGNRPHIIEKAINEKLVDYIAMDLKTSLENYPMLVGPQAKPENIEKSVRLLIDSNLDYEFRSTLLKEVHSDIMLEKMAELIKNSKIWNLQKFRPDITLFPEFSHYRPFSDEEMEAIAAKFNTYVQKINIR